MKETIEKLEALLKTIFERIELRLEMEQIDLKDYDESVEGHPTVERFNKTQYNFREDRGR